MRGKKGVPRPALSEDVTLTFPRLEQGDIAQDEEWFEARLDGGIRRIRFHDYGRIYEVPGLYEKLFYEELKCASPETIRSLLDEELQRSGYDASSLVCLDIGAGNGMVGEELAALGARSIVGVDIIQEAYDAVERDRPGIYDDYLVADLTALTDEQRERLAGWKFNCLTTVAALGFADIPPAAFATAYDLIEPGGWLAFTIKEDFLTDTDPSGFQKLIRHLLDDGAIQTRAQRRYRHRFNSQGHPLYYIAMVASKVHAESASALMVG
jgi:2-polyprenyl-3-methyl-5-hydroxy-6-metoxy-1,4-benzoquinol methylase